MNFIVIVVVLVFKALTSTHLVTLLVTINMHLLFVYFLIG
jgi:hypothetical protein